MRVFFKDDRLFELAHRTGPCADWPPQIVRGYQKLINILKAATDERDLYQLKSLHFEKLKGDRAHQRSLRINKQWRLIVELRGEGGSKEVVVVGIEDYH